MTTPFIEKLKRPEYTLGLDLGIASVGAALLTDERILALHVRTFDKAETAKEGESLNKIRRESRGIRRRLRRRAYRLERLRRLFLRHGLLTGSGGPDALADAQASLKASPWALRAEGLDRCLDKLEWASVLYHIVKHRGFQSNRKSEVKNDEKAGQMLEGVKANQKRREEKGYRTVGEMAAKDESFNQNKRNKGGDYNHTFDRADLESELETLFECQRNYGNAFADEELKEQVYKWLMARRPTLSGENLLEMVGYCTFEHGEKRIPKACYRFERFSWLSKLNNLKIMGEDGARELTDGDRKKLRDLPFEQAKLTYKQMRKKLDLASDEGFNGLSYRDDDKDKTEAATFFEAKAFHELRKAYKDADLEKQWKHDVWGPDREACADHLDCLGYALTYYKDDTEIKAYLKDNLTIENGSKEAMIEAVLGCSFDKFGHLSQKALKKILPFLEQGQRYDEACQSAGYHHSVIEGGSRQRYLPRPNPDDFRNPVVYRTMNQARKLVNAIVRQYGAPAAIHIELARDLSRSHQERKKIEKEQHEFKDKKDAAKEEFKECYGIDPNGLDLLKHRLYREQDCKCAYSLKPLDLRRLREPGYVEVDHALPFSRSFDDSQNNKVLVLTDENRNKGNHTPFEHFGGDENSPRWLNFEKFVKSSSKIRRAKRNRLLRKHISPEESEAFRERNLNDTRYICRAFKTMLEKQLQWHPGAGTNPQCVVVAGQLTALLRYRWGLLKDRQEGDLHHAVDAAVVAACSRALVKRMGDYAKRKELSNIENWMNVRDGFIDSETGEVLDIDGLRQLEKTFPLPWSDFPAELRCRLSDNPKEALKKIYDNRNYDESVLETIHPVHVSRMSTRRGLGQAHAETIRSTGRDDSLFNEEQSSLRTSLTSLKLKDLEHISGGEDARNKPLIEAIRKRLEANGNKGEKAFKL